MKIIDFINQVAKATDIQVQNLISLVKDVNINEEIPYDITKKLEELIIIDDKIRHIAVSIINTTTNAKFMELKKNFAKLQILVLLKKISNKNIDYNALQSLIDIFNNKIHAVNDVLLTQLGGGININEYMCYKYFKYAMKYAKLKFKYNLLDN